MGHIYTYDEIKKEFEDRGYLLLTNEKLKSNEKYEYICKKHYDKGSQFIDWGHFHCSGHGCAFCGREKCEETRRKDLLEYNGKDLAESKGLNTLECQGTIKKYGFNLFVQNIDNMVFKKCHIII